MAEPSEIMQVVLATFGAQAILRAPADALRDELYARIRPRLASVLDRATRKKAGDPITSSDRVSIKVLNEAAFTDDEVMLEYLGGVLAASGPDDDAGAAIVAQIGRLSAIQLRAHFVIYRELRRLWPWRPLNISDGREAAKAALRFEGADLLAALATDDPNAVGAAVAVLEREGLISSNYSLTWDRSEFTFAVKIVPTGLGANLFNWGRGIPSLGDESFWENEVVDLAGFESVPTTSHAAFVQNPPEQPKWPTPDGRA